MPSYIDQVSHAGNYLGPNCVPSKPSQPDEPWFNEWWTSQDETTGKYRLAPIERGGKTTYIGSKDKVYSTGQTLSTSTTRLQCDLLRYLLNTSMRSITV